MNIELNELREKLHAERQQLTERLNETDKQLASIDTVLDLLKSQTSQADKSQLPLLNVRPISYRLSGVSFKNAVDTILKDDPSKWWKPKEIFDTMLKEGFETNSKDFNNVARNMLMHMRKRGEVDITKARRGYMYKYKEKDSVSHMAETESNVENGGLGERLKPTDL